MDETEKTIPEDKVSCVVIDGLFVEPCQSLDECTSNPHPGFSKKKGIAVWRMRKRGPEGSAPSRTYYGLICEEYPNGFLFNHCPFCGEDISAPFMEKDF